ncbi:MAG TPA: universal stress protein [Burkholderiales bacterium]|jgi:nucleotide-binding universal stress UspA family protein
MFSHILVSLDGSALAEKACSAAIAFAKESGARITGYYAAPPGPKPVMGEGYFIPARPHKPVKSARFMQRLARRAGAAGVRFDAVVSERGNPAAGIADTAEKNGCDVIFMASRGRRGLRRLAEGSVTADVLAKTKVPVLVYR